MSHHRRLVLGAIVLASLLGQALPAGATTCAGGGCDPVVVGDPDAAAYVGSGGLLVDGSFSGDGVDRRTLAECAECRWWLVPACLRDPRNADAGCKVIASCPAGLLRVAIWFTKPGEIVRVVGEYCLGPEGPMTPGRIAVSLADRFVQRLPALRPGAQPVATLAGLPTCMRSGQAVVGGPWTYSVVGFRVVLRATTSWTWTFGDGGSLHTSNPGGAYPNFGVTHVFRRTGSFVVGVRSDWVASFTVDGLGPFSIQPPVEQVASLVVSVREARAVLVDPA